MGASDRIREGIGRLVDRILGVVDQARLLSKAATKAQSSQRQYRLFRGLPSHRPTQTLTLQALAGPRKPSAGSACPETGKDDESAHQDCHLSPLVA
jgi:hypothetical protein